MKPARFLILATTCLTVFSLSLSLCFSAPNEINYQGRLMDSSGTPVPDGNYFMMFLIYDAENSGSALWGEYHNAVPVAAGIYSVVLGTGTTIENSQNFDAALFSGEERWLEISVQSETLSPRQKISSAAYALQAQLAERVVDDSIATTMLQDQAIDEVKLADNAVSSAKIQDGSVTNDDIAPGLDADTVDGFEGAALEESAEIDADITTHSGVSSAHHTKTTSFSELTDSATDTQIPDTITIDQATNADTVDGRHSSAFADVLHDHSSLNAADGYPLNAVSVDSGGSVGIGTTSPEPGHKLHVAGLAKFQLGSGSLYLSTPGGKPGFIGFHNDGSRSDIVFHDNGVLISKNEYNALPSADNGILVHESGNVGIGTVSPVARLEVRGEVRTTDPYGSTRLWGQGRPGTKRYGTTGIESGLCTYGQYEYGLSNMHVDWASAAAACPQGTWVCTAAEKGNYPCDTTRPTGTASGDWYDCDGSYRNWSVNEHVGWVSDAGSLEVGGVGIVRGEDPTSTSWGYAGCNSLPVWCCSSLVD